MLFAVICCCWWRVAGEKRHCLRRTTAGAFLRPTRRLLRPKPPGRTPTCSSFKEAVTSIPGLTHYYPLTDAYGPNDAGPKGLNGINHGAVFGDHGATFNGKAYIELPDHDDFSAATTGQLTIVVMLTISNWKGAGASEYVHWMGKGKVRSPRVHLPALRRRRLR